MVFVKRTRVFVSAIKKGRGGSETCTYLGSLLVLLEDVQAGSAHLFFNAPQERSLLKNWLLHSTVLLFEIFLGLI